MTEPTDADRKHAAELIWGTLPREQVEAVARALAEARAPFLNLASTWERRADAYDQAHMDVVARDLRRRATAIRRAAGGDH